MTAAGTIKIDWRTLHDRDPRRLRRRGYRAWRFPGGLGNSRRKDAAMNIDKYLSTALQRAAAE